MASTATEPPPQGRWLRERGALQVTGVLEPAITEAPITLELVGSKGRVVRLVHTDPKGRYEVYLSNLGKGNYQLLASFGGDDLHASSESEPVKLRIT